MPVDTMVLADIFTSRCVGAKFRVVHTVVWDSGQRENIEEVCGLWECGDYSQDGLGGSQFCFDTLREAKATLPAYGARVESKRVKI